MDAADVCSTDIFVTFTDEMSTSEGSCLADNVVTRTWTVTDGCGNASTDVQVITLEDTTAPVVIYEENITLYDSASETIDDFVGITEIYDACSDYTYTTTDIFSGSGIYSYQLNRTMVFTGCLWKHDDHRAIRNSDLLNRVVLMLMQSTTTKPQSLMMVLVSTRVARIWHPRTTIRLLRLMMVLV
jgi:hypothetical protein